ncbi:molybdopterin-dependent oxidoreductase [Knoellia subterranea]|uniref:Dehydrogenase n=1 Tax=Knoellia subterranea KCTC 19937 TaxID=1385521 RepID=A0A0A0JL60_9MICO|nr:molybdopterin-dependent oxidoreductase [Knoellia subterranea]KGN37853.1 dehydrogenase [Knoellia subterranea KCTC 19937]
MAAGESAEVTRHITCVLCEASCGLEVRLRGEEILSIKGHADDPLSRGHICPKGVALQDIHADPDRLRRPVKRVGDEFVEIGWDEAIGLAAELLVGVQQRHGRDAVATYLGNPNVHSLGALTHGTAIPRALGSKHVFSATSVDQLPHHVVAWAMYGHQFLLPVPDIDRTKLLVLVGTNPMASNGSLWTVPDFPGRLRELRSRGGRLVVLDPRRTETAAVADEHHFVRPGTDAVVLLALVHVVLAEGLARPPAWADGVEQLRVAVSDFTPELAESVSGVAAESIRRLARRIASGSAAVHGRMGVSTQEFGVLCQWAIQCLMVITGNLDRPGGTMFTTPAVDIVGRGLVGRGHRGRTVSGVRGLPGFAGELPVSVLAEEMEGPAAAIRGLLTVGGNPVSSTPAGSRLSDRIVGLDAYVAIDPWINETTRHAHVILPPTGPLERDHYDLIFHTLAVRNTARWSKALFPRGEHQRHDWEIARDLVLALHQWRGTRLPLHRRVRLMASPRLTIDALLRSTRQGLSVRRLSRTPGGVDLGPLEPRLPERLMTENSLVDLTPPVVTSGLATLRARVPELRTAAASDDLLLIGRRHQRDNNSWMHNSPRLTKGRPRHHLLMHPDDLTARGVADGDLVTVTSEVSSLRVEVRASADVMRGVVSLPHGYGHRRPGVRLGNAVEVPGVTMNDLTDPSRVEGVSGNAVLNGIPVVVTSAVGVDDVAHALDSGASH